jgi:undecaprenyl-diphosphatase
MDWWQAMVLGIVEGVTEYLPVSSTGHLILTQRLLEIPSDQAACAYAISIQTGAILAVLGLYRVQVKRMLLGVVGKDRQGLTQAVNVMVAFLPAAVFGALFDTVIEEYLFGLWPIIGAWFVGGLAILVVSRRRQTIQSGVMDDDTGLTILNWHTALVIGFAQCLAMWPGTSRSLVTILAGSLVGLRLSSAVEFSFLLGVVTLTAATGFKMMHGGLAMVQAYGLGSMSIGFIFSMISATVSVQWLVGYLNRHSLAIFGIYRVALAMMVVSLLLAGRLMP